MENVDCQLVHAFREANSAADSLANHVVKCKSCMDFLVSLGLPCDVKRDVSQDLRGLLVLQKRSAVVFDDMGKFC